MMLSWNDYLKAHRDKTEYDAHAEHIQSIINASDSALISFSHLVRHPTLVCITKSSIGKEIQATFNHETRKTSLLSSEYVNLALMGFGTRACAIRIEPKEMFRVSANKKIPSFEEIMSCTTIEEVANLKATTDSPDNFLEAHAILPPILSENLFDLNTYKADEVLLSFIHRIRSLKSISNQTPVDGTEAEMNQLDQSTETSQTSESSFEMMNETDLANLRMNSSRDEQEPTPPAQPTETAMTVQGNSTITQTQGDHQFDNPDGTYKAKFGRVLEFLWGVVHEEKQVKPTKIVPIGSPSVMAWADAIHDKCIGPIQHHQLPPFHPPPPTPALNYQDPTGLSNVATAMTKLSNEMARKNELELVTKQSNEKEKSEKSFKNLSNVQKNIFKLITVTEEATDEDIDELKPTEHVITILNQKISIKAQAQLQHLFKESNHICDISLAMCTQLKNGTIASHPSVNDLNGISPLFLPEQSDEEKVTQELALRLEEQMVLGKISDEDMKTITKCRFHFPKNFGEYLHCIKNFHRLIEILAGPESILANKIEFLISHAVGHERCYKDIEHDYWYFYASLLQYFHRRTQHFVHSASQRLVSKLKLGKLKFADLLEDIEDGDYIPVQPKWLKQNKRSSPPPKDFNRSEAGAGGGDAPNSGPSNRRKKVRETVDNEKIDPELKCPANLAYREIFHPGNRKGVTEVPHLDGSVRCNNWYHRGWCTKDCSLKASHSKQLTDDEKNKCKEYLQKLIEKHKNWAGNRHRNNQG